MILAEKKICTVNIHIWYVSFSSERTGKHTNNTLQYIYIYIYIVCVCVCVCISRKLVNLKYYVTS
jgi:hypothetical protein